MTTLVYEELAAATLEQTLLIERPISLYGVRLWIYKRLNPLGDLKLTVLEGAQELGSSVVSISDFKDVGGINETEFWHGRVLFNFDIGIVINSSNQFKFQLDGINGYSYSSTNHVGWVKMYEARIAPMISEPVDFTEAPLSLELYNWSEL